MQQHHHQITQIQFPRILIILLLVLISNVFSQTATSVTTQLVCDTNWFRDPILLQCRRCPQGYNQQNGFYTSCYCNGKIDTTYPNVGGFICKTQTEVPDKECYSQFSIKGIENTDIDDKTCELMNNPINNNQWYQSYQYEGLELFYKFTTQQCSSAFQSNVPKLACPDADLDVAYDQSSPSFTSQFLMYHADIAVQMMNQHSYHQKLANLCSLTYQLQNSKNPCKIYQQIITNKPDQAEFFKYNIILNSSYLNTFGKDYNVHPLRLPNKQNNDSTKKPYINFKLLTYDLEGNFIDMEAGQFTNLDNQLFLCPSTDRDGQNLKEFGTDFTLKCNIQVRQFSTDRSMTKFYELLIETDQADQYLRVPVTIKSETTTTTTESTTQNYFTRFVIIDNISGFDLAQSKVSRSSYYLYRDATPSQIVIAQSMELKIKIQQEDNKISMPVLEIQYTTIQAAKYNDNFDISFQVTLTQDDTRFQKTAFPLFYVFASLSGIVWIFRFNIWSKYNPQSRNVTPEVFFFLWVANGIHLLINIWADFSFYYLFFMTGYWFVTYKFQDSLYTLMINTTTESDLFKVFEIFIIIQYSFKLASFLKFIYKQLQTDVLFIDWENQKQFDEDTQEEERKRGISVWRTLFIANEFNELSIERVTSFEWTLFWLGFFLTGLGWDNLGLEVPFISVDDRDYVRMNQALRYFIAVALYIVIVLIQIIIKRLFIIWNPTPIQNFTDLCTIANVSIFIMDEQLHGYYLHGKAPSGVAEGNTFWLKEAIEKEAITGAQRGLVKGENLQTFETYLPVDLRHEFNQEYKNKYEQLKATYNQDQWVLARTVVKEMINEMERQQFKQHITNVIKTHIKEVQIHSYNHVLHKSFLHRLLGLPPTDPLQTGLPFFFRDPGMNYCKIFYYGNEWYIIMFEMITFLFYNYFSESPLVAIMITFLFNRIFSWLRDLFGRRNISSKTMIDQRFLI